MSKGKKAGGARAWTADAVRRRGEQLCTKDRVLCTHAHKPKLFGKLVEGYYMMDPPGKRGHLSAFFQPCIFNLQAQSCSAFQPLREATLPHAAMVRLMQGVIDGTLGEEPTKV